MALSSKLIIKLNRTTNTNNLKLTMKRKSFLITSLMLLCSFVFGQNPEPHYKVGYTGQFENSMSIAAAVSFDGIEQYRTLEVGVFCNEEVRASAFTEDILGDGRYVVWINIPGKTGNVITFKVYDNMRKIKPTDTESETTFGGYANPSFEAQVETVGKASTTNIMSIEAQVEELWGDTKDDEWKAEEVKRIKEEKGIVSMDEPAINEELDLDLIENEESPVKDGQNAENSKNSSVKSGNQQKSGKKVAKE